MTPTPGTATRRPPAASLRHLSVIALMVVFAMFASTTTAHADVGLGTADSFALLVGQSVTNTGSTTITGDIGIHPGAAGDNVTGAASITHTGTLHDGDEVAQQAQVDLVSAYDDAAGRPVTETIVPALDGQDLGPGVYDSTGGGAFLLGVDGTLTLTGGPDDVWIFQSGSTLDFQSGSQVVLDGADPCNVFWQVTSSATLGTDSSVVGTIMALTSISLLTNATLEGRALARNGSVTLDTNTITNEACATPADDEGDDTGEDDTTEDDDATGEDDTTDDDGTTGEDDTTDDGETTGQIEEVPGGPVAAGGGPAEAATSGLSLLFAALLTFLMVGGTIGVIARRRVRG